MSNESYLLASNKSGKLKYSDESPSFTSKELLANSPMAIPIGWLAFFDRSCLKHDDSHEVPIPSLVSSTDEAVERFQARAKNIAKAFPEFKKELKGLLQRCQARKAKYLKVDFAELWDLDPDSFSQSLEACLDWFEAPTTEGFKQLLEMAAIAKYDAKKCTFPEVDPSVPREFHLVGYETEPEASEEAGAFDKKLTFDLDASELTMLLARIEKALPPKCGFDAQEDLAFNLRMVDSGMSIQGDHQLTINKKSETLAIELSKSGKTYHLRLSGTPVVKEILLKALKG